MKTTIKENLNKTNTAKVEAQKAAARKAELDAIEPKNIIDSISEIGQSQIRVNRDEEGNVNGINGGKYLQVRLPNGKLISGKTKEELEAVKSRIEKGIEGDGLLHKVVVIDGMPCECVGATEEELEADIKAAENYAQAHKHTVLRDAVVGVELLEAEINPNEAEQVEVEGRTFIILYHSKQLIDLDGNEINNIDHIKSQLTQEEVKSELLKDLPAILRAKRG